jgi:aspartate/methionine/tyrosine aminotransferase
MQISDRAQRIEPFYVMEVAKAARLLGDRLLNTERPMLYLNVGEPDFTAPPLVQEAAMHAIKAGNTQYTQASGMPELRQRISHWYKQRFNVDVPATRIVLTAGASAALQLACLALINSGDEILMPDPSYPCNRQFVSAADGVPVMIPTTAAERFQLSASSMASGENARRVAGIAL